MKCSVLNNKKWEKRFWINFSSVSVFHNEGGSKMSVEFSQLFDKVLFCIDESLLDEYGEEGIYNNLLSKRQSLSRLPASPFSWDNNTNKLKFCRMSSRFGKTSNWRCFLWRIIR